MDLTYPYLVSYVAYHVDPEDDITNPDHPQHFKGAKYDDISPLIQHLLFDSRIIELSAPIETAGADVFRSLVEVFGQNWNKNEYLNIMKVAIMNVVPCGSTDRSMPAVSESKILLATEMPKVPIVGQA